MSWREMPSASQGRRPIPLYALTARCLRLRVDPVGTTLKVGGYRDGNIDSTPHGSLSAGSSAIPYPNVVS